MNTLFLATVMGWYLVIVSFFILVRYKQVKLVMAEIFSKPGLFFIWNIVTLILGLLLVASHNVWVMGCTVIVTIIAWLILIGSLIRLFFSDVVIQKAHSYISKQDSMKIPAVIFLLIGLFLLYQVYFPYL